MRKLILATVFLLSVNLFAQTKFIYSYDGWGIRQYGKDRETFPGKGNITFDLQNLKLKIVMESGKSINLDLFGEKVEDNKLYYKCLDINISIIEFDKSTNDLTIYPTFYKNNPESYYYGLYLISKN